MAQPAAEVAPHVYTVILENDRLRLLEVGMSPGAESALHSHPDYLVYALSGGNVKLSDASGQSADVEIQAGDTMWRDAEEHSARNIGSTELRRCSSSSSSSRSPSGPAMQTTVDFAVSREQGVGRKHAELAH